jgi:pimeloyl-ACP methyl ester carboxylesterase
MSKIIWISLLAAGVLGASAAAQAWLTAQAQVPPPGKLVSIGDHRLHLNCQGKGGPAIVLESGLSGWSQDWAKVQPALARQTMVCSYDRAGYAWSNEAPSPRSGVETMEDLRTLLRTAGVSGPLVLVGHSWGGMLVQLYAQSHPDDVAGLVLIDALQHDMYASMNQSTRASYQRNMNLLTGSATWLAPLGLARLANQPASVILGKLPPEEQQRARGFAFQSKNYRALHHEYLSIDAALDAARGLPPLKRMPVIVLSTNDLSEFPPGWEIEELRQHWIAGQRLLAKETGAQQHIVSDGAGHYLQLERPELVTDAIRTVWQQASPGK